MTPRRRVLALAYGVLLSCAALPGQAEFYVWVDGAGQRRVSNIEPAGVTRAGTLRRSHDPRTLAVQQRALVAALAARDAALAAAARGAPVVAEGPPRRLEAAAAPGTAAPGAPREGYLNLPQLIELERRGGRYVTPD